MKRALQQDEPVRLVTIPLPKDRSPLANLTIMRAGRVDPGGLLAIVFEDAQPSPHPHASHPAATEEEPLVTQLEAEVRTLRAELRNNAEGYDVATEELKAANEEVMSMNEELQSANEELEASKEELQSVNEELTTVNAQLNDKVSELTESNNDLANLLGSTEIATLFLDAKLRIRRFTSRATALLNLIDSDLGRPVGHITQNFSGIDLAADADNVRRCLSPIEKEVQARDGQWYTVRILPYRTLDDRIDGIVITFTDVTRLKKAEQDRRELEHRVLQAQKLESLGLLAGGIAHDFNNVLMAMLGHIDLSMLDPTSEQARKHVQEARSCVLRASELTAQMLAYAGKGVFKLQSVDLNAIIRSMAALLAASISKKVTLEYRLAAALPPISADATQLRQVILNLLLNASEATADASGTITVTTVAEHLSREQLALSFPNANLPDGDYVSLEVGDTGCGMTPATMAKAFEPFFTTKFAGRGLGLSVVAGIIKSHHGAVVVHSTAGSGSLFRMVFPVDQSPKAMQEPLAEAPLAPEAGGGTILFMEDDASVQGVTTAFLEELGFIVLAAQGGAEGLEIFRERFSEITLVLMDVTMPGMDTKEILVELHGIRQDVPVLLCSGYSEHDIWERFADNGVSGFIAKPFTITDLASGIAQCLRDTH